MRRYNPAMNSNLMQKEMAGPIQNAMTVHGTIQKTGVLTALLFVAAAWSWSQIASQGEQAIAYAQKYMMISALVGFGIAMATVFLRKYAGFLAPLYALVEGLFLGSISMVMEQYFPGIVFQAILGTMSVFAVMLFLYDRRIIRVTDKLRSIIFAATGAVFLMYLASWVLSFFGVQMGFLHSSGPMGIGISLLIIGVAAFNLLLDFDMIEQYAGRMEKYMEWYCGFALLVTLVWLYMEILRLLAKTRD